MKTDNGEIPVFNIIGSDKDNSLQTEYAMSHLHNMLMHDNPSV